MSLYLSTMSRPACFCLVLSLIILMLFVILIPFLVNKVEEIEEEIKVYTSGHVEDVLLSHVQMAMNFGFMLIILLMITLIIYIATFAIFTIKDERREIPLFVELTNQMESTQEMMEETIQEPEVDGIYHLRVQKEDNLVDYVNEYSSLLDHVNEHSSENLPLTGKKILLVEDHEDDTTLVTTSQNVISMLGATIHICRNHKESIDFVRKILINQCDIGPSTPSPPFNYIIMDCEKLNISGFAATKCIRKELLHYGFRIPIMALTINSKMEVIAKICEVEMDYYLPKPLRPDLLLEAIDYFEKGRLFKRLF